MGRGVPLLVVANGRTEAIGSSAASEKDAAIRGASKVVNSEVAGSHAFPIPPADSLPLLFAERLGETDEGVNRQEYAMKSGKSGEIRLTGQHHRAVGPHLASSSHQLR